ncbi:5'/3'-nucleotidase SurE [Coprobacter tertius]|uniref:5'-nucleotidase SurE n=1 Tax=Coprobacter tertius TaxID=2944915 RepID=A0ABT1MJW2_9BACT|nr:5'/3'-nucleotidase SurE [Coprobacter tertius]MCP9612900.1 5'/3'-nucleotidase SurE [Coprobacter tertius]
MTTSKSNFSKPLILVTNDDGIDAKGINELIKMIDSLGEILVVAPDSPRSGQSSAISSGYPLRLIPVEKKEDFTSFKTNGTPVDCIKLALNFLCDRRPDLLVSGINHGSNAGVSVVYSGTMGAAIEGAIVGIPSAGFSLCSHNPDANFSACSDIVTFTCRKLLEQGLPQSVCLNINIPASDKINGVKVCRQAHGYWTEEYDRRTDPYGKDYFWLTGQFINLEPDNEETDEWALAHNYISVVPTTYDQSAIKYIDTTRNLFSE